MNISNTTYFFLGDITFERRVENVGYNNILNPPQQKIKSLKKLIPSEIILLGFNDCTKTTTFKNIET